MRCLLVSRPGRYRWLGRYGRFGWHGRRRWRRREFAIPGFGLPGSIFIQHVSLCFAVLSFDYNRVILPTDGRDRRVTVQEILVVFGIDCFFPVFNGWNRRRWRRRRNIIRQFHGRRRWRWWRRLFFALRLCCNGQGQHGTCYKECFLHKLVYRFRCSKKELPYKTAGFIFPERPALKNASVRQV